MTSTNQAQQRLSKLIPSFAANFPSSTASPSFYFHFPGCTPESTSTVRRTIEENDRRHDIYEKARFAHNHISHSLLTRYALGASSRLIEDALMYDAGRHVSLDPAVGDRKVDQDHVPEKITRENWMDEKYLGQKDAYSGYLIFFHDEVQRLGPIGVLEEYIFSPKANYESNGSAPGPHMLERLVAGVLHPFIHVGFGLEFRDQVMLAEGLAEAAVHSTESTIPLLGNDWPKGIESKLDTPPPAVQTREQWTVDYPARQPRSGKSLLQIYAEVLGSDTLKPVPFDKEMMIVDRLVKTGQEDRDELHRLAKAWSLSDEELRDGVGGWERKVEEIAILVTLLACGSGRKGKAPRVDFFLMHTLTSSIFLPAYMTPLSISQRRTILRTYLLIVLLTAIARGRPQIDFEYLMSANPYPVGPNTGPEKWNKDHVISNPTEGEARNPWLSIIDSSLYHHDSHVPKSIRSLVHYDSLYGSLPLGGFIGSIDENGNEVLPGIGKADGTVFRRGAGLLMDALGWCREGQEEGGWEFSPIGYDEVWQ